MSSNLKFPFQKPPGLTDCLWFPLLALPTLILADTYLIPQAFMLPLMLLVLLGYMAVRLPTKVVFLWVLIFAGVVLIILLLPWQEGYSKPALAPYVRTATFLTGGIIVTLLVSYRTRIENSYNALLSVVSSLPLAVIVSDISGNILLLNKEAEKLLQTQSNDLVGLSFFSTFTSPGDQGREITKYLSFFDPNHLGPTAVTLQSRGHMPLLLQASISVVGWHKQFYAVTVIEKAEQIKK